MRDRLAEYLAVLGLADDEVDARLTAGQFNDVVLIGEVAYRFPRDEASRATLPAAVDLLTALSKADLPTAVPRPLETGHLGSPLGECHVPLTRLHGQPFEDIGVGGDGDAAEEAVIGDLAMLLDRLADLGSDPAIASLVPRTDPDYWPGFASQVRAVLYPLISADGRGRADTELAAVTTVPSAGDALVHSDLGGANLLWTATGGLPRLAGVLDWDETCIGDQASDLASIAVTVGWPLTRRIDARRRHSAGHYSAGHDNAGHDNAGHDNARSMLADAMIIAATFALQQALPAALSGDQANLDDGLREYR